MTSMRRLQPTKSGPMAGHVRVGRRYMSELAATGALHLGDWVRDDLPDLLWPVLLLAHRGTAAARDFIRWQAAVQGDFRDAAEPSALAECLDGRLTNLDRLVDLRPGADAIIRQRADELELLPPPVSAVLSTYPERPAAWLVEGDPRPPSTDEVDLVARALVEAIGDGHREAVIKCLRIWSAVQAGTFSSDKDTIELLIRYPDHSESRARADTVVRASWGAAKMARTWIAG